MATTVEMRINATDAGSFGKVNNEAKKVQNTVEQTNKALAKQSTIKPAASTAASKKAMVNLEGGTYGVARGTVGTGAQGRDFAKQAQGLGGLVHVYATFAANIFAVGAAFNALKTAMDFEVMLKGAKLLEASTGASIRNMADTMKQMTEYAISSKEALQLTTLASSAGLTRQQIEGLTKGAKGASIALGRDMSDSITRVIRGVTKLEPELLDELGVTVKATEAQRAYAKSLGLTVDDLTSYQKILAYTEAVQKQLNDKFKDAATLKDINPYTKLLATTTDAAITLANTLNKVLGPVVNALADNLGLVVLGILAVIKSLVARAVPELGKMFTVDPKAAEAARDRLINLEKSIIKAKESTHNAAKSLRDKELADIKAQAEIKSKIIEDQRAKELNRAKETVAQNFGNKTQTSSITKNASSFYDLQDSPAFIKAMKTKETVITNSLAKEKEQLALKSRQLSTTVAQNTADSTNVALLTEQVMLSKVRVEALSQSLVDVQAVNKALSTQIVEEQQLLALETKRKEVASKPLPVKDANISKQLTADKADARLFSASFRSKTNVEEAKYLHGAGSVEHLRAQEAGLKRVEAAARMKAVATGHATQSQIALANGVIRTTNVLTLYGQGMVMASVATYKLSTALATAGAWLSKAFGWISLIGTILYGLYEIGSWALKATGMISEGSARLDKAIDQAEKSREASIESQAKYTSLLNNKNKSTEQEVSLETLRANTYSNSASELQKLSEELEFYNRQKEKGVLDGEKQEKVRKEMLKSMDEAISKSEGVAKAQLEEKRAALAVSKDITAAAQKEAAGLEVLAKQTTTRAKALEGLQGDISDIAASIDKVNKKEFISDDGIRKSYEKLDNLKKNILQNIVSPLEAAAEISKSIGLRNLNTAAFDKLQSIGEAKSKIPETQAKLREAQFDVDSTARKLDGSVALNEEYKARVLIVSKLREQLALQMALAGATKEEVTALISSLQPALIKLGNKGRGSKDQQVIDLMQSKIALAETEVSILKEKQKTEERYLGYAKEETIEQAEQLQLSAINARFEKDRYEAEKKFKAEGNKALKDNTLSNLKKQEKLQKDQLKVATQIELTQARAAQYALEVTNKGIRQLDIDNSILEGRKTLNEISEQDYINEKYLLDLKKIELDLTQKIKQLGNDESSPLVKDAREAAEVDRKKLGISKEINTVLAKRRKMFDDELSLISSHNALLSSQLDLLESVNNNYNDKIAILGIQKVLLSKQLDIELKSLDVQIAAADKAEDSLKIQDLEYQKQTKINQANSRALEIAKEELAVKMRSGKVTDKELAEDFGNKIKEYSDTLKSGAETLNEALVSGLDKGVDDLFEAIKKGELTLKGVGKYLQDFASETLFDMAKADLKKFLTDTLKGEFSGTQVPKLTPEALVSQSLDKTINAQFPLLTEAISNASFGSSAPSDALNSRAISSVKRTGSTFNSTSEASETLTFSVLDTADEFDSLTPAAYKLTGEVHGAGKEFYDIIPVVEEDNNQLTAMALAAGSVTSSLNGLTAAAQQGAAAQQAGGAGSSSESSSSSGGVISGAWDWVKGKASDAWDWVTGTTKTIKEAATTAYDAISETTTSVAESVAETTTSVVNVAKDAISSVSDFIGSWFAKGGVFGSQGVRAFANGGTFTNSIVNSPTPFAFENGGAFSLGVMGEAGSEAIMPLARTASGSLGVSLVGAFDGISGWIKDLFKSLESVMGNLLDSLKGLFGDLFGWIKNLFSSSSSSSASSASSFSGTKVEPISYVSKGVDGVTESLDTSIDTITSFTDSSTSASLGLDSMNKVVSISNQSFKEMTLLQEAYTRDLKALSLTTSAQSSSAGTGLGGLLKLGFGILTGSPGSAISGISDVVKGATGYFDAGNEETRLTNLYGPPEAGDVNNTGWSSEAWDLFAKGGSFSGSSDLSKYSNSIVNTPTLFAFAKGSTGLMGEAGPEAVVPLKRMPDGNLGVRTTNNNNADNSNVNNLTVNINSQSGNPDDIRRSAAAAGRSILAALNGAQRYG